MNKLVIVLAVVLAIPLSACDRKSASPAPEPPAAARPELSGASYPADLDYPIRAKEFAEVSLTDRFWKPKMDLNAAVTIPAAWDRSIRGGRKVNNNILEAAIDSLRVRPDPGLQAMVDARLREMAAAPVEGPVPDNEFFEVAAADFKAAGHKDLLAAAVRSADLIYDAYRKETPAFSGGERDAINCLQLYRVTREAKYLELAKLYLDIRGLENSVGRSRHNQSHMPVVEQGEAVGHAVNDASLMYSLVEVGTLTGRGEYVDAARRIWRDAVGAKLYVTGGIGSTGNEGFGRPCELPNISAYSETCAAIMFAAFNHRLFLATGDARYIDVMELSMYNNILSGVSASGDRFFYVNRLASAGDGRDVRWDWASLPCCPPNLVRFMATMPGYVYAQSGTNVYVNLYVSSAASFDLGGKTLSLAVDSGLPWSGSTRLAVSVPAGAVEGGLKLRIPGWAGNEPVPGGLYAYAAAGGAGPRVRLNGEAVSSSPDESGYVTIDRTWRTGDVVEVDLPLDVRKIAADSRVREDGGKMAVQRGPIVYCAEWPDFEGGRVLDALFDAGGSFEPAFEPELFGGAVTLAGTAKDICVPDSAARPIKLIPYHLWANRGPGEMCVWLPTSEYAAGGTGPAGGLIFYVNPNSASDGWRYLEAAPFDQSAGAPWGCFRRLIEGARGTEIGTGRRNTRDILAACAQPGTAAALCDQLSLNGFDDWFLPSQGELLQLYLQLKAAGLGSFQDHGVPDNFNYWTSTQVTADMARHLDFADNGSRLHYDDKDFPRRVRAVRAF